MPFLRQCLYEAIYPYIVTLRLHCVASPPDIGTLEVGGKTNVKSNASYFHYNLRFADKLSFVILIPNNVATIQGWLWSVIGFLSLFKSSESDRVVPVQRSMWPVQSWKNTFILQLFIWRFGRTKFLSYLSLNNTLFRNKLLFSQRK